MLNGSKPQAACQYGGNSKAYAAIATVRIGLLLKLGESPWSSTADEMSVGNG